MRLAIPLAQLTSCSELPRLAIKFFEPVFTAPLEVLPPAIDFKAQLSADLAAKISYDSRGKFASLCGNHD